jgi:DNA primase
MDLKQAKDYIKENLKIEEVIGNYVKLKKSGKNFNAPCPFHAEDAPSFFVFPKTQTFKCFGCGEQGDIISFVEKYENLTFTETIKKLAIENGIEIEKQPEDQYKAMLNDLSKNYYNTLLNLPQNHPAKIYALTRFSETEINEFNIGYSTGEEYKEFYKNNSQLFKELNYKEYDMFKNRIIFPIKDVGKNTVGFTARSITNEKYKYLNSPDSFLFNKKNILYGIDIARKYAKENDMIIVTEGLADTIKMHSIGFKNTIGLLGLDISLDRLKLISRLSKQQILMMDNDKSGIKAINEYIEKSIPLQLQIAVPLYKEKDPDELITKYGKDKTFSILKQSIPGIDFFVSSKQSEYNLKNVFQKQQFMQDLYNLYNKLLNNKQPVFAENILNKVEEIGITKESFLKTISEPIRKKEKKESNVSFNYNRQLNNLEKTLIVLIINADDKIHDFLMELSTDSLTTKYSVEILENYQYNQKLNIVSEKYEKISDFLMNHYNNISSMPKEKVLKHYNKFKNYIQNNFNAFNKIKKINEKMSKTDSFSEKLDLIEQLIVTQKKIKEGEKQ